MPTAGLNASGCAGAGKASTGNRLCFSGQQIALGDDMVFTFTCNGAGVTATEPHMKVEFVDAKGNKVGSLLSQTLPAATTTAGTTTSAPGAGTSGTTGSTTAASGTTASIGTGSATGSSGTTVPTSAAPATNPPTTTAATTGTGSTGGSSGDKNGATTNGATTNSMATAADTGTVDTAQGGKFGTSAPAALPPAQDLPTTIPVATADPVQATGGPAHAAGAAVPEPESIALLLGGLGLMGLVLRRRSR